MLKNLNKRESFYLIARYVLLALLSLGNLYLFYLIFTPLTIYPVYIILKLIYPLVLIGGNTIIVESFPITIIGACVAGAAYYLLTIVNLTTPMSPKTRLKSLLFLFTAFLAINIARIVVFSILATNNYSGFSQMHTLTWYLGSTLLVVALWFLNVRLFSINSIPVYTDFKRIINSIRRR
jgi:exosortase/archaeosortase family protein